MITKNMIFCPVCGTQLKYYDKVNRIVLMKWHKRTYITMRRFKCVKCKTIHREIPSYLLPYKHYESEIIIGVIEGLITSDTLGFEDYPCELTMKRWKK